MWAALLPILIPIAESALAGALGWAIAHWGPSLGISPTEAAVLSATIAKLAPTNTTAAVAPAVVAKAETPG